VPLVRVPLVRARLVRVRLVRVPLVRVLRMLRVPALLLRGSLQVPLALRARQWPECSALDSRKSSSLAHLLVVAVPVAWAGRSYRSERQSSEQPHHNRGKAWLESPFAEFPPCFSARQVILRPDVGQRVGMACAPKRRTAMSA